MEQAVRVIVLAPQQIPESWWLVAPWLDKALEPIGENADAIYPGAYNSHYQLWLILRGNDCLGAFCTCVALVGSEKILEVYALAGRGMKEWWREVKMALERMEEWVGAEEIHFQTKRRAARWLKKVGFEDNGNGWKKSRAV